MAVEMVVCQCDFCTDDWWKLLYRTPEDIADKCEWSFASAKELYDQNSIAGEPAILFFLASRGDIQHGQAPAPLG
jgi:hypothetical protein